MFFCFSNQFQKYRIWTLDLVPVDAQNQMDSQYCLPELASTGFASLVCTITVIVKSLVLSLYICFSHTSISYHGIFSPEAFNQSALYSWVFSHLNPVCARSLVIFLHGCVIFQWVSLRFSRVSLFSSIIFEHSTFFYILAVFVPPRHKVSTKFSFRFPN